MCSVVRFGRQRRRQARHLRRLGNAAISEGPQHFEYLAPGWEGPAVLAFVLVHRLHELNLIGAVIALAGGRIDLPPPFALLGPSIFAAAALDGHRDTAFTSIVPAPVCDAQFGGETRVVAHG